MTGVWVLVLVLSLATAYGFWQKVASGGVKQTSQSAPTPLIEAVDGLGELATLVQFSSAFCAPCRATKALLADIAEVEAGVKHVEIDAENNLALVRELHIRSTPTTLILDGVGHEVGRAIGAPKRDQVLAALAALR